MSVIWDLLQASDLDERERVSSQPKCSENFPELNDRRASERRAAYVPVFVYGYTATRQPFHEDTHTLDVSQKGGLLHLDADVRKGQRLLVVNKLTNLESECDVVHLRKRRTRTDVGVALAGGTTPFWQEKK